MLASLGVLFIICLVCWVIYVSRKIGQAEAVAVFTEELHEKVDDERKTRRNLEEWQNELIVLHDKMREAQGAYFALKNAGVTGPAFDKADQTYAQLKAQETALFARAPDSVLLERAKRAARLAEPCEVTLERLEIEPISMMNNLYPASTSAADMEAWRRAIAAKQKA